MDKSIFQSDSEKYLKVFFFISSFSTFAAYRAVEESKEKVAENETGKNKCTQRETLSVALSLTHSGSSAVARSLAHSPVHLIEIKLFSVEISFDEWEKLMNSREIYRNSVHFLQCEVEFSSIFLLTARPQ